MNADLQQMSTEEVSVQINTLYVKYEDINSTNYQTILILI